MMTMYNPPHPGTVLGAWLRGRDAMTLATLARHIGAPRATLSRIVRGHAAITRDIALGLESALGPSTEMWAGMQSAYDVWAVAQESAKA